MTEKRKTGFAAMTPEQRAAAGKKGGRAAQKSPKARRWTPEEALARAGNRKGKGPTPASFTSETGKTAGSFTSETGREAAERKHDLIAMADPEVTWLAGD